jgi:hypothetical protein
VDWYWWQWRNSPAGSVTRKVDPNISVSKSFSHVVTAMKIADAEVELGLDREG